MRERSRKEDNRAAETRRERREERKLRDRRIEGSGHGKIMKVEAQPGSRDDNMKQNKFKPLYGARRSLMFTLMLLMKISFSSINFPSIFSPSITIKSC